MNWKKVKLGEICSYQKKSSIKAGEGEIEGVYPFFTSSTEQKKFIDNFQFEETGLIFGTGGKASVHYCDKPFAVSTDCVVLKDNQKEEISLKFLLYYLSGNIFILENGFKGAGLKHISKEYISNIQIPLPDLATQKHIAEVLNKADALRQQNRQLLAHYDELLQSTFIELFGDPVKNPKGWEVKKLGEVCRKITDGTHKTPNYQSEGVTFISAKNIKNGEIDWSDLKFLTKEEHLQLYKRCNPEYGDVLITKSGSIGMAAIVKERFEFSLFESLALVKLDNSLTNYFFRELINSNNLVHKFIKGVGVKHLHLTDIRNLPIPVPPLPLQQHFAKIVEQIESQKAQVQAALAESESLFEGLLAGYFNA